MRYAAEERDSIFYKQLGALFYIFTWFYIFKWDMPQRRGILQATRNTLLHFIFSHIVKWDMQLRAFFVCTIKLSNIFKWDMLERWGALEFCKQLRTCFTSLHKFRSYILHFLILSNEICNPPHRTLLHFLHDYTFSSEIYEIEEDLRMLQAAQNTFYIPS